MMNGPLDDIASVLSAAYERLAAMFSAVGDFTMPYVSAACDAAVAFFASVFDNAAALFAVTDDPVINALVALLAFCVPVAIVLALAIRHRESPPPEPPDLPPDDPAVWLGENVPRGQRARHTAWVVVRTIVALAATFAAACLALATFNLGWAALSVVLLGFACSSARRR